MPNGNVLRRFTFKREANAEAVVDSESPSSRQSFFRRRQPNDDKNNGEEVANLIGKDVGDSGEEASQASSNKRPGGTKNKSTKLGTLKLSFGGFQEEGSQGKDESTKNSHGTAKDSTESSKPTSTKTRYLQNLRSKTRSPARSVHIRRSYSNRSAVFDCSESNHEDKLDIIIVANERPSAPSSRHRGSHSFQNNIVPRSSAVPQRDRSNEEDQYTSADSTLSSIEDEGEYQENNLSSLQRHQHHSQKSFLFPELEGEPTEESLVKKPSEVRFRVDAIDNKANKKNPKKPRRIKKKQIKDNEQEEESRSMFDHITDICMDLVCLCPFATSTTTANITRGRQPTKRDAKPTKVEVAGE